MSTPDAFAAVEALRIVLREEQPAAMADVLLDMERARMTAEDLPWRLRAAMASPYSTNDLPPHRRTLSWREFGIERNDRCDHVTFNVIEPATQALDQMCSDLRTKLTAPGSTSQPGYKVLETAHNDIRRIQSILREEETSEDDETSGDDATSDDDAREVQ